MKLKNNLFLVKVGMILTFVFIALCCWSVSVKADMISTLDGVTVTINNGVTPLSTDCSNPDEYCIYQVDEKFYITAHYSTGQLFDSGAPWTSLSVSSVSSRFTTAYLYNSDFNFYIKYDLSTSSVSLSSDGTFDDFFIALDTDAYFDISAQWFLYLVDNDMVASSDEWYSFGYNSGYASGSSVGYDSGYADAYDEFYMPRYNEGLVEGADSNLSILSFIPGIMGVAVGFFFQILSVEALGISGLEIVGALVSIVVLLLVFKMFISRY